MDEPDGTAAPFPPMLPAEMLPTEWANFAAAAPTIHHRTDGRSEPPSGGAAADVHRISKLYGWLSAILALLAVCTTAQTVELAVDGVRPPPSTLLARGGWTTDIAAVPPLAKEDLKKMASTPNTLAINNAPTSSSLETVTPPPSTQQLPAWVRWVLPLKPDDETAGACAVATEEIPVAAAATKTTQQQQASNISRTSWQVFMESFIDPSILQPLSHTLTDLIDKVLTSTPRLLAMANFLLSLTYLLHTAVANFFLGPQARPTAATAQHREKLGGFLVFKLLLISAVIAPDTLDLLILLSWYTLLSFLRSLAALCAAAIQHGSAAGQAPQTGVLRLLVLVWVCNLLAAAVCVALFHGAGAGMVWLLTTDCALLGVDVCGHVLQHMAAVWEVQQATTLSALEEEEEARLRAAAAAAAAQENDSDDDDDWISTMHAPPQPAETTNQRRIRKLEQQHSRRMQVIDGAIFAAQLVSHILTVAHFLHIWSLHGLQLTLIDGVLALHLHSAVSSASRQIAQRRNLHRIARHLDAVFEDATEMELRKHTTDVCCVCLCGLSSHVKKVACGHLYHSHCLREVVERARSMETARCPLCRACVLDGGRPGPFSQAAATNNTTRNLEGNAAEEGPANLDAATAPTQPAGPQPTGPDPQPQHQALFRFSTETILPAWMPVPNFSFEIVRRPPPPPPPPPAADDPAEGGPSLLRRFLLLTGAVPMTPAEEAAAAEQLVDMFPQYDRADLVRELRQRGSMEAVTEAILAGVFTGVPR